MAESAESKEEQDNQQQVEKEENEQKDKNISIPATTIKIAEGALNEVKEEDPEKLNLDSEITVFQNFFRVIIYS